MLSVDARGHGSTTDESDQELDLSLETLTDDLLFVVRQTKEVMQWDEMPPIVLVGHSLGGAVVTTLAKRADLGASVLGFAVLDVVEGSAMDALQSMITYLSTRPSGFPSLESGIDWHLRSRTLRNTASARTSVPALLEREGEGPRAWRWKTDLAATQRFWEGWFVGLSKKFLEARGGKLLLLAGTDRLDTELTIGQMQGEFGPPRSCLYSSPFFFVFFSFLFFLFFSLCQSRALMADEAQASTRCRSSRRQATSSTRTCPTRRPCWSLTFTAGMTGARWCSRPRCRIC